ncbi:MAG: PD40 domain-containing protein [Bacteroidetes bacterium]|nr:PD40 domain-containing protein [Bacteroidota bacterium]
MKKFLSVALICILAVATQTAQAQLGRANKRFDRREYAKAIPLYQRHLEKVPISEEGMEKLAHSYRQINDSRNAEYWYNRLIKAGNKDPQNVFYFAQMLINNEKWEDAAPLLEKYLQERDWDEVAQNMLKSAKSYKEYMADSTMYIVKGTNINTAKAEFSPTIYRNSIVFASSRTPAKNIFNWTGDNFLDLYQAQYFGKAELGEPQILPGLANSKYHEGGSTFSPDGNLMYFTRNNYNQGKLTKGENGLVRLKTFQAELVRNKWDNIKEVPFNGEEFSVGHPSLSPDGSTFFFVSDMTGGEGGTDIWMAKKQGETWSKPENMGPRINTPGNDMFPWVSPTGVFYFSSNGHPGLGGLDLYRVTSVGTEFEKVQNMGYPVNSPRDDFSLVIDEKSGVGFFSSNRKGGKGDDDIYSFIQRQVLEGHVVDASTGKSINNAKVEIYGVKGLQTVIRTDSVGHFRYGLDRNTDYKLVGSGDHYLETQQIVSTVSFDPTVPVETLIKLEKDKSDPIYNLKGKLEADSIVNLEGTKVRIIAKEVVVMVDENGNFEYHLAPETDYEVRVEKEGFMDKVMDITTKGMAPGDLNLNAMLMKLMPDTALYRIFYDYDDAFVRSDAYKELDKVLEFMKRNPTAKIRLVSHADPRGSESYNEQLSRKRTNSAFTYLMRHGIAQNRLEQVWLGERSPKNKCRDGMDCTEEEYQENRQTEIQFGGKIRDREMPKLEVVPMDPNSDSGTSKADLKMQAEPSGKEKIKAGAPTDPKDSIKEGTEVVEPTKESAPAEQPKEEAKTEAPATTPAEQPKEEAKTAAPASTPAEQPKEEAKTAAPASTPAEQPKEEAKTAAPASTPAEQPKEEAKTAAPVEKEMVEELRKPENLIQDFDAPADSAKGGNAVPVTPGSGTAADGKPK